MLRLLSQFVPVKDPVQLQVKLDPDIALHIP